MLSVRLEQLEALQKDTLKMFAYRLFDHIESEYPEDFEKLGTDGRWELINTVLRTGKRLDILGRGSLVTLTELMLEFGIQFELSPDRSWAEAMLEHRRLPGAVRVQAIAGFLRSRTDGRRINKIAVNGH